MAGAARAQVTATGTMGPTNPPEPTLGTPQNQSSMARLLSVNSIDDFCVFAPPEPNSVIGNTEEEEVAWCVQARNNARVIPDGTFTAVHFVKSPLYVQVMGMGDFTKINIADNDEGGELDPHGATGNGNPVGGNVTSNVSGSDVHYEEWMNYMAYNQFCIRICTAENSTYSAAIECQHTLDEMGCNWVMPGDYTDNSFTSCEADAAYPPGVYPLSNGSTSTFAQRYTGTFTDGAGSTGLFTIGETVTPQTPYSTPASSNCQTFSTISNGMNIAATGGSNSTKSSGAASGSGASTTPTGKSNAAGGGADAGASDKGGSSASGSAKTSGGAIPGVVGTNFGPFIGAGVSVLAVVAGAGALLL